MYLAWFPQNRVPEDSPEEGTSVSQLAVLFRHVMVNALTKAQFLFLLVIGSVLPHQEGGGHNATRHANDISALVPADD